MTQTKRAASYLLLLVSILAVSTAAILIRLVNDQASALVIAVYRLGLSTVLSGLLYLTASANHRALTKKFSLDGAFGRVSGGAFCGVD